MDSFHADNAYDAFLAADKASQDDHCVRYALFVSHFRRSHFDQLYWLLFAGNVLILVLSSTLYSWAETFRRDHEDGPGWSEAAYRRKLKIALAVCAAVCAVTLALTVLQVFALLGLQFCDGEPLMPLYWATFNVLQVGGTLANVGVVLALVGALSRTKHPVWTIALGTPVLVVVTLGHFLAKFVRMNYRQLRLWKTQAGRDPQDQDGDEEQTCCSVQSRIDAQDEKGEEKPRASCR